MLENILNIFRVADLRKKIAFTLMILAIYRFGAFLPAPGVDVDRIGAYKDSASQSGGILQYLQLFSGGALTNLAMFALGIMPYITSSIIMQILGVVVPKIEQWQQQGAVGQRKITQWTRYLADRHLVGAGHQLRLLAARRRQRAQPQHAELDPGVERGSCRVARRDLHRGHGAA